MFDVLPLQMRGQKITKLIARVQYWKARKPVLGQDIAVVVVVYFILIRLLYLAFIANLGLLCMPHPAWDP